MFFKNSNSTKVRRLYTVTSPSSFPLLYPCCELKRDLEEAHLIYAHSEKKRDSMIKSYKSNLLGLLMVLPLFVFVGICTLFSSDSSAQVTMGECMLCFIATCLLVRMLDKGRDERLPFRLPWWVKRQVTTSYRTSSQGEPTRFFLLPMLFSAEAQMFLSVINISEKLTLPYLKKKVFKMLVRKSAIIWQRSWS